MVNNLKKTGAEDLVVFFASGPKRFTDAMQELRLVPSTLSRRLKDLIDQGLIKREYDPVARTEKYALTEKGREYYREITCEEKVAEKGVEFFKGFGFSVPEEEIFKLLKKEKVRRGEK